MARAADHEPSIINNQMPDTKNEILVWLPSPMGDAILCTPALRAIRQHFKSSKISFFAGEIVREVLSPSNLNDIWLEQQNRNPFMIAKMLKDHKFTHAILFKNSFASSLAVFLAGIPVRIGYARQGRGFLLTDKLYAPKLPDGKFKPISMIDYYLAIACWLDGNVSDKKRKLTVEPQESERLRGKLTELVNGDRPVVILVPGGAFGLSKCWPAERFAQLADWLVDTCNARVVVSVSSSPAEKKIARDICNLSSYELLNLAERPVSLGELKALFSVAELVITNDTGPRHIAIALGRKVVTLFGPNDPAWTDTNYEKEIQIVGNVPCSPCVKPVCRMREHFCMKSISIEMVCKAARELIEKDKGGITITSKQNFVESSKSFFIDPDYRDGFEEAGLREVKGVLSFRGGENLNKKNLASYRSRFRIKINNPATMVYLKRYDRPPVWVQLKSWFCHRKRTSCAFSDFKTGLWLEAAGINVPKTICYGQQWGMFFEKRSFIVTEEIGNAESLEEKLPDYFSAPATIENLKLRRDFIVKLAAFIKKFHQTGYRHRDLYFSHIFYNDKGEFYLIDLARAFKPVLFCEKYRVKDIAQLHYSARRQYFSNTDRLRFYLELVGRNRLTNSDKRFIRRVIRKGWTMARHNIRHGREVPFTARSVNL